MKFYKILTVSTIYNSSPSKCDVGANHCNTTAKAGNMHGNTWDMTARQIYSAGILLYHNGSISINLNVEKHENLYQL